MIDTLRQWKFFELNYNYVVPGRHDGCTQYPVLLLNLLLDLTALGARIVVQALTAFPHPCHVSVLLSPQS